MENENKVLEILDTLRNYSRADDSFELLYILLSYKVLADFKHEKEYLRTPHILENYVETIDFDKIKETSDLKEVLNQMNFLNISPLSCHRAIENLDESISDKIIKILEKIDFSKEIIRGNYDVLRDNFLGIIENLINNLGRMAGEFITPSLFSKTISEIINIQSEETLYDPCYGYGFLANIVGEKAKLIIGQDINEKALIFGKLNSLISNKESELILGDSLKNPIINKADVVVTNYPFGLKTFGLDNLEYGEYKILPASNADYHFLTLCLSRMRNRGAIIVTDGVLFRGSKEREIRKNIINDNLIDGIISLPGGVFKNTSIPANIVFFSKTRTNTDIFMIDSKDIFTKTRGGVDYSEESLQRIISTYKNKESIEGFSRYVSLEEIRVNEYLLSVNKYIDKAVETENIDTKDLIKEIKFLEKEIKESKKETDEILKRLMEEME